MTTGYADYVAEATRAVNDLFLRSYRPNQKNLAELANIACNTLERVAVQTALLEDLRKLAYTQERYLTEYKEICERLSEFTLKFYRIEELALVKAGVEPEAARSLLERAAALRESARDSRIQPDKVWADLRELGDEACKLAAVLDEVPLRFGRRLRARRRLKKITYAIGGVVLIGVDAAAAVGSVGLSAAATAVSGGLGSGLVGAAVTIETDAELDEDYRRMV